jgi:hypothetical protein
MGGWNNGVALEFEKQAIFQMLQVCALGLGGWGVTRSNDWVPR